MDYQNIKVNSGKAWFLAARPKTLGGAVVPVLIGGGIWYAIRKYATMHGYPIETTSVLDWLVPFVLALLFALVMQIDANFINDYFGFKNHEDTEERIGPKRACSEGWITPEAMKRGIFIASVIACVIGIPLIYFGGWWMAAVGAMCLLFAFLYTTYLSHKGLGELLVLVFFGVVPVYFTYYAMGGRYFDFDIVSRLTVNSDLLVLLAGVATGVFTCCLLMANNYRDIDLDTKVGKKTFAVIIGKKWSRIAYCIYGWAGILLSLFVYVTLGKHSFTDFLWIIPVIRHNTAYLYLQKAHTPKELNVVLVRAASNILIFGIVFFLMLVWR